MPPYTQNTVDLDGGPTEIGHLLLQLSYETIVYAYARTVLIHQCLNKKYKLSTEIF